MELKDSGARREFETGAVRDIDDEKGRCDLLPLNIISTLIRYDKKLNSELLNGLNDVNVFIRTGEELYIIAAIMNFIEYRYSSVDEAIFELSKHYKDGAQKYSERNWEKGIPTHCFVDSAIRHYIKFLYGWEDEPHDRAYLWNLCGLLWTVTNHPELNDLPYVTEKEKEKGSNENE